MGDSQSLEGRVAGGNYDTVIMPREVTPRYSTDKNYQRIVSALTKLRDKHPEVRYGTSAQALMERGFDKSQADEVIAYLKTENKRISYGSELTDKVITEIALQVCDEYLEYDQDNVSKGTRGYLWSRVKKTAKGIKRSLALNVGGSLRKPLAAVLKLADEDPELASAVLPYLWRHANKHEQYFIIGNKTWGWAKYIIKNNSLNGAEKLNHLALGPDSKAKKHYDDGGKENPIIGYLKYNPGDVVAILALIFGSSGLALEKGKSDGYQQALHDVKENPALVAPVSSDNDQDQNRIKSLEAGLKAAEDRNSNLADKNKSLMDKIREERRKFDAKIAKTKCLGEDLYDDEQGKCVAPKVKEVTVNKMIKVPQKCPVCKETKCEHEGRLHGRTIDFYP